MKNNFHSPEEEAELTLNSLDRISQAAVPDGFDQRFFERLDAEFQPLVKTPNWFWAAAVALFLINGSIAWNYLRTDSSAQNTTAATEQIYFQGGTSWF